MCRVVFVVIALSCHSTEALARINVVPSLEWLADTCIDSGVYAVSAVSERSAGASADLTLTLTHGLKGQPPAEASENYITGSASNSSRPDVAIGDEFLVCFERSETGERRTVQVINLANPQMARANLIAASTALKLLKTKGEILKVFEDRLHVYGGARPLETRPYDDRFVEVPRDSEVANAASVLSPVYLRIPADLLENVKAIVQLSEEVDPSRPKWVPLRRPEPALRSYIPYAVGISALALGGLVAWGVLKRRANKALQQNRGDVLRC